MSVRKNCLKQVGQSYVFRVCIAMCLSKLDGVASVLWHTEHSFRPGLFSTGGIAWASFVGGADLSPSLDGFALILTALRPVVK